MTKFEFAAEVFSPRWGHTDRYSLTMTKQELVVNLGGMKSAACKLGENGDPEWSGYQGSSNPVMNIFRNDRIFAPIVVPFALEWAWRQWREGEVEEPELREGLRQLFTWIDQTARSTPDSDLWSGAF